ncbi:ABC transporter ATP-binding protein [uncultured Desulfuromonas sp.]|uniref:ABC transporter ATP-binding protein n=1 Tax=uncultured Desulfuromonas sp. TaxID=181013 RepID=UPI002AAA6F7C|nr:ABC transporter ATP-binding protein [uncultured Desulfuromonas sp.]
MLEIKSLCCGYKTKTVLKDISFTLGKGELLCLLGPNGVGKTTLFKTILGLLPAQGGEILLDNQNVATWSRRRFAARVGYVPQAHTPPFPFRVLDVVATGRTAHIGLFSSPTSKDFAIAEEALSTLGIHHLREHTYTEISGGERQLVLIARALTQQTDLLIMDEPTSNLDYGNQIKVLDHIRRISRETDISIILTTHYPNHALLYASKALILDRHSTVCVGRPHEVITEQYLHEAYQVKSRLLNIVNPSGAPLRVCVPA